MSITVEATGGPIGSGTETVALCIGYGSELLRTWLCDDELPEEDEGAGDVTGGPPSVYPIMGLNSARKRTDLKAIIPVAGSSYRRGIECMIF